ncbi:hypothetical protein [Nostoc sp.]|uniref:hypothetical protein n=1 Tax=Nostoc sp. TaxID=1180 RepID=UPI002FF5096F
MEILTYWILQAIIYLLPGICYSCYYYYYAKQEQDHKSKSSPQQRTKYSNTYLTDPRNRELQAKLLEILQGDVSTAKELLLQQRRVFPGRHDNWYLEKVICNIEQQLIDEKLRNYEMHSRLLRMLQGDNAAVDRLLRQQIETYPGKHFGWYLEKVTYDLERDRR